MGLNMGKDNSIKRETKEIDEFKKTVSRATSEINTSIGNIENLNKETVQTAQKIQNAGNEIRKAANEIKTIKNDKKGEEDAEYKKEASQKDKIIQAISFSIPVISLFVALATLWVTYRIGVTANDMNMKTQEITYSFSNDVTHNTNVETLNKEFSDFFEHRNRKVIMDLEKPENASGEINESQIVYVSNLEDDQIEYIGAMFSCYPVKGDICGDVTGIIVSSDEDAIFTDGDNFVSKFLPLNEMNTEGAIEHLFVFDDFNVHLVIPKKEKHISFMISRKYSEEKTEPVEHTVYVALQGYSGKLRQFAIRVRFDDSNTVFSTIDENDIYELENVYSYWGYIPPNLNSSEEEADQSSQSASKETTNGDDVKTSDLIVLKLDDEQKQEAKIVSETLESHFTIIKERYEK